MPGKNLNNALRVGLFALLFAAYTLAADPKTATPPPGPTEAVEVQTYFWNAPRKAHRVLLDPKQKPTRSRIWNVVDDEEWLSSVLFGKPELYEKSEGVIMMIPGMGGNVAKYGIASSTSKFADISLSLNFYPVAVQNRVYQGAMDPNFPIERRKAIQKELEDLDLEMREQYLNIRRVMSDPTEKSKSRFVYGRSNGSAKIFEMLHRMACDDDGAIAAGSMIDTVLLAGVNSPRSPGYPIWTGAEDMENKDDRSDYDEIARDVDRAQYRQMSWDNEGLFISTKLAKFPKVVIIISKQDHYVPVALQIETARNFAKRHPQIEVEILLTPTKHDPTQSFVVPNSGLVHNGAFLSDLIKNHLHLRPVQNRVSEIVYPHFDSVPECAAFVAYPAITGPLAEFVRAAAEAM